MYNIWRKHRLTLLIFSELALLGGLFYILALQFGYIETTPTASEASTQETAVGPYKNIESPFRKIGELDKIAPDPIEAATVTLSNDEKEEYFKYIKIIDSCEEHYEGECLNARTGPDTNFPVAAKLRNNMILRTTGIIEENEQLWYKVVFDEWLRYPERVTGYWYVAAEYVEVLLDEGVRTSWEHGNATNTKTILVNRSDQTLMAYEDGELFMELSISTGLALTPTPAGTFSIFKKTPSRYMQGPLPGLADDQYYDLPGVPWNLYFTHDGAVIHGTYWHDKFGDPYSHGCVNLPPEKAGQLYDWADLGTTVTVVD